MFLQVSDSVHRGGACSWGVPAPGEGVWSGGCLLWGCLVRGVPAPRGGACSGGVPGEDPPRRLLLRAVRILLECILVLAFKIMHFLNYGSFLLSVNLHQLNNFTQLSCF